MKELKGKNALVTGGAGGLGRYIARSLAREYVNVAISDKAEDKLAFTFKELSRFSVRIKAYTEDISKNPGRIKLVEKCITDFGRLDLLINNAAIDCVSAYTHLSSDEIEAIIKTNLVAPMILTRLILPVMLKQGGGHIVTISSLCGKKGSPYSATYAATKAGLIQWSNAIRAELRSTDVSVSVICPGFISEVGMFASYKTPVPRIAGTTTAAKVSKAVIQAIKKDIGEIIVNPVELRPLLMLDAISPNITNWMLKKFGMYAFSRQIALNNDRA